MSRKQVTSVVLIAAILLVSFFLARPLIAHPDAAKRAEALPQINNMGPDKYWVCPMHPEITQDHPGVCPICGMKLVESGTAEMHAHGIRVDSAIEQRLGVRLARSRQETVAQPIETYGNVVVAENQAFSVQPKYEGWIKKLYVHAVGEEVRAGQVLYDFYSPDLVARQRTYLSSIERRKQLLETIQTTPDTENDYVMEMAMDAANDRAKLHQEEGVSVESIRTIEEKKQASDVVQIVAARSGVVSQVNVREGSYVMPSNPLLVLADVSRVWVEIALYPDQAGQVKRGDSVVIRDANGQETHARLSFINPLSNNNKVIARAVLDNANRHYRPGTFVDVTILTRPHQALVVPRSAVLYTGRGNVVMLSRGEGHFLPVAVTTGVESGDRVEILDGLQEGAEVVVNGQFLLDSAASLSAASERMHGH
ncbi:cation efflux system protein CusB [Sideroxyarcus emersonii]|uniref:Cation efflux system protein CusB n=1 Tax=Sideroxyarcus emersonii TaxID=2764705 RepID=A0AAN1X945_9PROT|nr:efflux RND transporter periplasmic adaptor subunit [Sideroxyarcus emersonii]BCK87001.1 cation efflux system protein CusB [Sideroxyarcus emersonii]